MRRLQQIDRRISWWLDNHHGLLRRAGFIFAGLVVFVVLFQLAYPSGRALPFVRAGDHAVGGKSISMIKELVDAQYKKASLTIATQDTKISTSFDEAGIDVNSQTTANNATHYPFIERFIPFSSVAIMMNRNTDVTVRYDDDRLSYFASQTSRKAYVAPVNASVDIKESKVVLVPAQPSKSYGQKDIINAIKNANFLPQTSVTIKPMIKDAERTDDEVQGVLKEAQKAVDTPLTLSVNSEKIAVPKSTIATWLDFIEDTKSDKLQLTVKSDTVKKYLDSIQGKVYKAPGVTTVQIIDGQEVGRTVGASGRGIDVTKSVSLINSALHEGKETTISVPITQLAPTISYKREYSNSDAGLAALLQDIAGPKGFGVTVMSADGQYVGNANGSKQFEAASTYKLFVAYAVFQQMKAGTMHWTDSIDNGRDANQCFDDMIVKSDNPCAKGFAQKIGWQNVENQMHSLGLVNTDLTGSTLLTSANDLALYLYKLNNGSLLSTDDQTRLIDAMKRQVYRSGIPAGVGGLSVADKVGFVDDVIHDAGIVYGPHGPYVLVIMTSNSSWSTIANIASQVNSFITR